MKPVAQRFSHQRHEMVDSTNSSAICTETMPGRKESLSPTRRQSASPTRRQSTSPPAKRRESVSPTRRSARSYLLLKLVGLACCFHVLRKSFVILPDVMFYEMSQNPEPVEEVESSRFKIGGGVFFAEDQRIGLNASTNPCPPKARLKTTTKGYTDQFERDYPVKVPIEPVVDWGSIPCSNMPPKCNLQDTTYGNPFLMVSFGRSGTTSTWDIIAALTGDYIPHASEDMGQDKTDAAKFFAGLNHTEHGKCWLERLLCQKQAIARKAYKKGKGKASMFGSKWKPWHVGLNTTLAREALQWLGTQPQIKVVYNTRNMLDMYISMNKHHTLNRLFGAERMAHCYDDKDIRLSDEVWKTLESIGIPRTTPCAQIFKQIEANTTIDIAHMFAYLVRNSLQTDYAADMLDYYNVSRVTVTYEKLYFSETAEEWMRIFRYLGYGPTSNLTLDEVFLKTSFQKTSANDRSKRMKNYDRVVDSLRCTKYAKHLD